jgi:Flp pilus assembly protein TadD
VTNIPYFKTESFQVNSYEYRWSSLGKDRFPNDLATHHGEELIMRMNKKIRTSIIFMAFFAILTGTAFGGESSKGSYERGLSDLRSGRLHEAINAFSQAIYLKSDHADAYNDRGLAYYEMGRYTEAELDFRNAVLLDSNHEKASNNLGLLLFKRGGYDEALRYLNRALALSDGTSPHHQDIFNNLSIIYAKKGMSKEAEEARNQADQLAWNKKPSLESDQEGDDKPSHEMESSQTIGNDRLTLKFYKP